MAKKKPNLKSKKKAQANKKLIAIVLVAVVATVGLIGGFWFLNMYQSAGRNIAAGDAYMADKDYKKARKMYGRAISKEPADPLFVKKLQEATLAIVPVTPLEAQTFYNDYLAALVHEARYNPLDAEAQYKYIYELYNAARLTGFDYYWQRLRAASITVLERLPLDDSRRYEANIYLGLSSLHIEDSSMTDKFDDDGNIRFPGELDLFEALEHDPGNALAWSALAHGRMAVYYRLMKDGRIAQAKKNRELADKTMQEAQVAAGGSIELAIVLAREASLRRDVIIRSKRDSLSDAEVDEATAVASKAIDLLVSIFDPVLHQFQTPELIWILRNSGTEGRELAVGIVNKYLDIFNDDTSIRFQLTNVLFELSRLDEAKIEAIKILDAPQASVSIQATDQFAIRPQAASILFHIARNKIRETEDEEEIETLILEAKVYREKMLDFVSGDLENPYILEADGDLAMLQNDFQEAVGKFELLIYRYPHPITEGSVYTKSGYCLLETGSTGLAQERLSQAIDIDPNLLNNYILKAKIEMALSKHDEAYITLSQLPPIIIESSAEIKSLLDAISYVRSDENASFNDPFMAIITSADAMFSSGDFDGALATLKGAMETADEPDWRIYSALAILYFKNGETKQAIEWIDKGIALEPDNRRLKTTKISFQSEDRVAFIIAVNEESDASDSEKAINTSTQLYALARNLTNEARRWEMIGSNKKANSAQEIADSAITQYHKFIAIAEELGSDLSILLLLQFNNSIIEDLEKASELLSRLKLEELDESIIDDCEVRLLLAKARKEKDNLQVDPINSAIESAYKLALASTKKRPFSAIGWHNLGLVHGLKQNKAEALLAYEEAYRLAPDNIAFARRYLVSLLNTDSDAQRIMRVVRDARKSFPNDSQLLETWLSLENRFGDVATVVTYRTKQLETNQHDRTNALQLALLLVNTELERKLILDKNGSELFSPKSWARMSRKQQNNHFEKLRKSWDKIVQGIMEAAQKDPDPDMRSAIMRASIERDRGQLDASSAILDKYISEQVGQEGYTTAVIAAANFLQGASRFEQAKTLLESAMDAQSPEKEISAALGSLLLLTRMTDYPRAAQELGIAARATKNPITHARWIEALIYSGDFDGAELAIEGFKGSNIDYAKTMLQALIHRRKSEILLAKGKSKEARGELERYRMMLSSAILIDKKNPVPYIKLCRSLISEFNITQNKELLSEALEVSENGSEFGESVEDFTILRSGIWQLDGQLRRAIESLDVYLAKKPDSNKVRQKLIDAHLDADDLEKALAVAVAGVAVNPASATWHKRLGDLHLRATDNRALATQSYLDAIALGPTLDLVFILDNTTRTNQSLPYRNVLQMARGALSNQHPIVKAIEAKALRGLGQKRDADIAMRSSWESYQKAIEKGWDAPSSISRWFANLAILYGEDVEAGEQFALQLIGSNPAPEEYVGLANYWWELSHENIEKSLTYLNQVIDDADVKGEARISALMIKGGYLVDVRRYVEGEAAFRLLNEENPNAPFIMNNLAFVIGVYLNNPQEGLALSMQAAEIVPNHPSIIDTVSKLYELLGDDVKAAETLDFLLQIDPVNADAMARLSLILASSLNQPERALLIAQRARSQQPRSPAALDALGWSYIQNGQLGKGERFLQRSIANGENALAYLHMAQLVIKRGEYEEALGHLRIAQELASDQPTLDRIHDLKDDIRKTQATVGD
jgi:tetratricopeptide (TPR) repeat protein